MDNTKGPECGRRRKWIVPRSAHSNCHFLEEHTRQNPNLSGQGQMQHLRGLLGNVSREAKMKVRFKNQKKV